MTVTKRGSEYHYRFMVKGRRYSGNTGCADLKAAQKWERDHRRAIVMSESSAQLIDTAARELNGGGRVECIDAWRIFLDKPRRPMSAKRQAATLHRWADFVAWLDRQNPAVRHLDAITLAHAEAYVCDVRARKISAATANDYQQTAHMVLQELMRDAGLHVNPFAHVKSLDRDSVRREPYSPDEIQTMLAAADGWLRHLLLAGLYTGLRKGDILDLRWRDVDLDQRRIVRKLRKTGEVVRIPLAQPLYDLLTTSLLPAVGWHRDDLVFVELAALNHDYITRTWKRWLKGLGIEGRRTQKGRAQAASVKDIHSLRHTFVTECGARGIPLPVVQGWVGHMTDAMTRHYTHATESASHAQLMLQLDYAAADSQQCLAPADSQQQQLSPVQALADQIQGLTAPQQQCLRKLLGWPHPSA